MINAPKWEALPTPAVPVWGPIPQSCFSGYTWELRSEKRHMKRVFQTFTLGLNRVNVSSEGIEHYLVPNIPFHPERKNERERERGLSTNEAQNC